MTYTSVLPSRDEGLDLLDRFGAAALAGLSTGLLVGGVGGRLAMFLLRLTSDDSVRVLDTDDGFEIGSFTAGTFFLLGVTAVFGAILAFAYLLVRRWLPERRRPLQMAVFFGLVGGSVIVKPDGVDFNLLDPLPLAVALFVLLPAAYGAAMAASVEWLIDHPGRARKARVVAIVLFAVVGILGTLPALLAVVGFVLLLAGRRWPVLADLVSHPTTTWVVRIALVVLTVFAAQALISDVAEIL